MLAHSKYVNSEVPPFTANIDRFVSLIDDGDTSTVINATDGLIDISGNNQRFGRVKLSNTHGSELNDLSMPMVVEYLTASGYVINNDDSCTTIMDSDLVLTDNLIAPGTSTVEVDNIGDEALEGVFNINLTAPGNSLTGTINVSPDLNVSLDKWLRYSWSNGGEFDEDPSAIATFGIFKGNPVQIYIQQTYQ